VTGAPVSSLDGRPADQPTGGGLVLSAALLAVLPLVAAEALVAFVDPVAGAVVHALLLWALLVGWVRSGDRTMLALALVPLGRVTSLALTLDSTSAGAYALAGLPLLVAVVWSYRDMIGWRGRRGRLAWHAVVVALSGIPLGFAVHALVDLPRAGGMPLVLAAPVVFVFAGVLEELVYRGPVQRVLTRRFGTVGVVLADLLFTAAYLPTHEAGLILAMAVLGLAAGFYVRQTLSLTPVAVAHGLLAAGALVVWPLWG
jgi:membrane protease YdiL (CAAX protease family)